MQMLRDLSWHDGQWSTEWAPTLVKLDMYDTRDAASTWERDWQEHVESLGFKLGLKGTTERVTELENKTTEVSPIEGKTHQLPDMSTCLWKGLRLEGNSVQTPATYDVTEEEPGPLDQVQDSECKSQVARCLFLNQDRADITFIANELSLQMSNPTQQSLAKSKRREGQWGQIFNHERIVEEVTTFSDSDWAGYKETRKSSSAGVILLGMNKKMIIGRSTAEAEVSAPALRESESSGAVLLLKDLSDEMKSVLVIVVQVTADILHRERIDRLKHIDSANFWMLDEDQIQVVASVKESRWGKRCRSGTNSLSKSSDCKTLFRTR